MHSPALSDSIGAHNAFPTSRREVSQYDIITFQVQRHVIDIHFSLLAATKDIILQREQITTNYLSLPT